MADQTQILIVLIAGIGDMILATQSIRAIRNAYPDAKIHILTSTESLPVAKNCRYINQVWCFPVRELQNNKYMIIAIFKLLFSLRKIHFNILVNFYRIHTYFGAFKMGLLSLLLKADNKTGHDNKGFGFFIDKKVPQNNFRDKHFADAMLSVAELAGGIPDTEGIEISCDIPENNWGALLNNQKENKPLLKIAINPGGARKNRRWSTKKYARTANLLADKFDADLFILGGPGEEKIAEEVQSEVKRNTVNLAGKLSINDLVWVISRMDLLITNDSAPMHIAAAVKTPVTAVFGPENPLLFGPYTSPELYRVVSSSVDCRPCRKKNCKNPDCLDLITPAQVFDKCVELLEINSE